MSNLARIDSRLSPSAFAPAMVRAGGLRALTPAPVTAPKQGAPFQPDTVWHLWPETPPSPSLLDQARQTSPAELQQMLKKMPIVGTLGLWNPDDTRAPHRIIRSALATALKDKQISVPEALELRGLLLQLPRSEREPYKPLLAKLPQAQYVAPIFEGLDLNPTYYTQDFTPAEFALLDSPEFKLVFPNFTVLTFSQQRHVLSELEVYFQHFPNLLQQLNSIPNENYGPGFQFFFVDRDSNKAFDTVLPKGVAGIVMPGVEVVKDPLLGLLAKKVSLRMLDRGGMYDDYINSGVFSHEFAHVIHLNLLSDDQRDTIKNLYDAAWRSHDKSHGAEGFVSNYAQTNPYEYFADGMQYYLTGDRQRLQRQDPGLYRFIEQLLAEGKTYSGEDGNLFNDPESVHLVASSQGGQTLGGISLSRESDLVSMRHFEASSTQEVQALGGDKSALARAAVGLKAGWKPWDKPASVYATVGGVAQAGLLAGKVSAGAGGYAGVGVDYGHFNAEVRQSWMAGKNTPPATEVRLGYRFEF